MSIWTYNQASGELRGGHFEFSFTAYSGFPPHKDVPADEALHGLGPIPRGAYDCGAAVDHPTLGFHVIPLTPRKFTDTHGRDGFYVHGDSAKHPGLASRGCIVASIQARESFSAGDVLVVWA